MREIASDLAQLNELTQAFSTGDWVAIAAAVAAIGIVLLLVALAMYVYFALALMTIANRLKVKNSWLAWIPIANIYLVVKMAKQPWWHIFGMLLTWIPAVGSLLFTVLTVFWWWKISEFRKRPNWWGILMVLPVVNLVILGVLAWSKK